MELKTVQLSEVEEPTRNDKLHPRENEDEGQGDDLSTLRQRSDDKEELTEWEEFRLSVGNEPNKPIEVRPDGSGYELIDGDRRLRALRDNDTVETDALVHENGEVEGEHNRLLRMVTANEFRKPSDKSQRSRHIAQLVSPWLLSPGDRKENIEQMTQGELAQSIGKSQSTISIWLRAVRNQNPIRAGLETLSSSWSVTSDEMKKIDEIVDLLIRGGETNNKVVTIGQEQLVRSELEDMEGVSISEVLLAAEKSVSEGWNTQRFLEYINEEFAYNVEEDVSDVSSGVLSDNTEDPFTDDDISDTDGLTVSEDEPDDFEESSFDIEKPELDLGELLDEDSLPRGVTVQELENNRMMYQTIEDDAAVMISALSEMTGASKRDVIKDFVEPLIIESGVSWVRETQAEELEQTAD